MANLYKKNKLFFILTNIGMTICVGVVFFLFLFDIIPQKQPQFYCNDTKIAYTYTGDTVTTLAVILMSLFIPICLIMVVEMTNYYLDNNSFVGFFFIKSVKIPITWCLEYVITLILNFLIIHIFKFTFGEPRPDFLDTCQPDACSQDGHFTGLVTKYTCEQTTYGKSVARSSTLSFLSGHAACSVYAGIFMFWYIQKRVCEYGPRFVGHGLQLGAIIFSVVCSVSRITDHRHHWWDVLCGAILGALLAVYVIKVYCKNFYQIVACDKINMKNDNHVIEIR